MAIFVYKLSRTQTTMRSTTDNFLCVAVKNDFDQLVANCKFSWTDDNEMTSSIIVIDQALLAATWDFDLLARVMNVLIRNFDAKTDEYLGDCFDRLGDIEIGIEGTNAHQAIEDYHRLTRGQ